MDTPLSMMMEPGGIGILRYVSAVVRYVSPMRLVLTPY